MTDSGTPWARLDQTFAFLETDSLQQCEQNGNKFQVPRHLNRSHNQQLPPQSWPDEQLTITSQPPLSYKRRLHDSLSTLVLNRSLSKPFNKPKHQSQPSSSSIASSVSSFNMSLGSSNDSGVFTLSSPSRGGSYYAPTTLLRPAQTSAGWFSSEARQPTLSKDTPTSNSCYQIDPPFSMPVDLPQSETASGHTLLPSSNIRLMEPFGQPPLQPPDYFPPLTRRSRERGDNDRGRRGSSYPSHSPEMLPRSAIHGDTASLFSEHSMNSLATSTERVSHNHFQHDSSSLYSESRVSVATAKHSPSLPSLSSFNLSQSRLKPSAATPSKAVRKFVRMAGKAASSVANSAKDAIKSTLQVHSNDSTISIGSHSLGGTPAITVTRPAPSPRHSAVPPSLPPQLSLNVTATSAIRPSLGTRHQSLSKIRQLTGLDMGAASTVSSSVSSDGRILSRSRSVESAERELSPNMPTSPSLFASSIPRAATLYPTPKTTTTRSIWSTSILKSDESDEHENNDAVAAADQVDGSDSISSASMSIRPAVAKTAAAGTPNPTMASFLRSHTQLTTQPQPVKPARGELSQLQCPILPADFQQKLMSPRRPHKIKRFSDPIMAPIIEHPNDTSKIWACNSSRASSVYSCQDRPTSYLLDSNNDGILPPFIPSRPAPVPDRSTGRTVSSPTHEIFPPAASNSAPDIVKQIPTIRVLRSSFDNQASATSPTSPASGNGARRSVPVVSIARKKLLPTTIDISNPWPISPPPRPPRPPPLHPIVDADFEDGKADERRNESGSYVALFQALQSGEIVDFSRVPAASLPSSCTVEGFLHARTKSSCSASESIATSVTASDTMSVTNSSTSRSSGSSVPSSTAYSTTGMSHSAAFGSISSSSSTFSRHSYQSPLMPPPPPPPPNYPLPPLPVSTAICESVSMPMSKLPFPAQLLPTRSAFDEDDGDVSASFSAARKMKKSAIGDSERWRATAFGRTLSQRGSSSDGFLSATSDTKSSGIPGSRSSLPATTRALPKHDFEMSQWHRDMSGRSQSVSEPSEMAEDKLIGRFSVREVRTRAAGVPPPTFSGHVFVSRAWPGPIQGTEVGGMI